MRLGSQLVLVRKITANTGRRIDLACPSSFHEFEGPDPIPYDVEGVRVSLELDFVDGMT